MELRKIILTEKEIPRQWYNVVADMPNPPLPALHPTLFRPLGPGDLDAIFPHEILEQEASTKPYIDVPEEVLNLYRIWRPTPLYRARNLERALKTPARLYYKWEGPSPAGSHKPNSSIAQVYYNKVAGTRRMVTETGAGQWGSALALACNFFGLELKVYMVRVSLEQKPYRASLMRAWGAEVVSSPSPDTPTGRKVLKESPGSAGSLAIAISEALEDVTSREDTKYALGSLLNHVCMHQTIIGQEVVKQLALVKDYPDVVIACIGGGTNFMGFSAPFIRDRICGKDVRIVAVEPAACPSLTRGMFAYDYADVAKITPLVPMYTLGHDFVPDPIHAGGLRHHGMSPIVSQLYRDKLIEARAYNQLECFEAAVTFARSEGFVPAPEPTHAIRGAVDEAIRAREEGKERTIIFNVCGHGDFDMQAYDDYVGKSLIDVPLADEELERARRVLEGLPRP